MSSIADRGCAEGRVLVGHLRLVHVLQARGALGQLREQVNLRRAASVKLEPSTPHSNEQTLAAAEGAAAEGAAAAAGAGAAATGAAVDAGAAAKAETA